MAKSFRFYQWGGWGAMAAAFFMVFIHRFSIGAVADNLSAPAPGGLGLNGTQLGNLASAYFYLYALMQIPTGLLSDSVGPRRSATAGMCLAALGAVLTGLSPTYPLLLMARGMVGMGTAVVYVSTLRFQSEWFSAGRFATITGLTSVAGNLGAMFAAAPLALAVLWLGWRGAFTLVGIVTLAGGLVILGMVRDRPADAGFGAREPKPRDQRSKLGKALLIVAKNPLTWLYFMIYFGSGSATFSFNALWGIPYLMQVYGLPKASAASLAMLVPMGVAVGSPLWGWLSDNWGRKKPIIVFGLITQFILWLMVIAPWGGRLPVAALPPVLFLIGLSSIVFVLTFAGAKEGNDPSYAGTAISVVNAGGFLGGALMNMLVGRMLDARWTGQMAGGIRIFSQAAFHRAFLLYLGFIAIGIVCVLFVREKKKSASVSEGAPIASQNG